MTFSELADRPGWKGSEAGKHARHRRVVIRRGKAGDHECARCAENGLTKPAREWAQVHDTDGNDPWSDFIPLCRKCHFRYDELKLGGVTQASGSKANTDKLPHKLGERHPSHKLTEDAVRDIKQRLSEGEKQFVLAEEYGVHRTAISAISTGRTWGWLTA